MSVSVTNHVRFARALRSRPFSLLWIGQTISVLGNGAFSTALAWEVLLLTGSATAMGLIVSAQVLPVFLFPMVGGIAADLLPRRLLMLFADVSRAALILLAAILGWMHILQFWHLAALSFCFGFVKCFFDPAYQALRPQLIEAEALPSANAMTELSKQVSLLLGPLLGAVCVSLIGPAAAFAFDGLTFLLSAFTILLIRMPSSLVVRTARHTDTRWALEKGTRTHFSFLSQLTRLYGLMRIFSLHQSARRMVKEAREGFECIIHSKWLWTSILVTSIVNIGYAGSLAIGLPKLVHDVYHAGVWLLGLIAATSAFGSIAATAILGQIRHIRRRGLTAYLAFIVYGVALLVFGIPLPHADEPTIVSIASVFLGFSQTTFDIIWITVMQELIPNKKLGRVSSIDALASYIFLPLGYALGGMVADRLGPASVFLMGGALIVIMAAIALSMRDLRQWE